LNAFGFASWPSRIGWCCAATTAARIARYGLSFGGLFEPEPLSATRMAREIGDAALWALGWRRSFAALLAGLRVVVADPHAISLDAAGESGSIFWSALGHRVARKSVFTAATYQSASMKRGRARVRVLGTELGPGILVTSALLRRRAFEHGAQRRRWQCFSRRWLRLAALAHPGVGAGLVFHALCNSFASYLSQSTVFAVDALLPDR